MIGFLCSSVLFVFFLNLISSNLIVWWSGFLLMTLIFVFLNKNLYCYSSLLNYFIIQEVLGLLFLFLSMSVLQFLVLMMKVGISPLHFWIFSVTNNLWGWGVLWFLTFQKMPFFPVIMNLMNFSYFLIIIFGIIFCYLQFLIMKNYKNLIILSSTESFNWILLVGLFSIINVYFLFIYYIFLMVLVLPFFINNNFNFLNWEVILVFLNMPFTFTFFIKLFSLSLILEFGGFMFLFILFMMFLSMLSFSFFLVNLSTLNYLFHQNSYKLSYFLSFPLMVLILI
uniref:NADH dehydrogenase subunit 2 n=1 Tax=Steinernema glaseri TaxID=37863 RepID=A0A1E1G7C6_9BILA|nr:NADH dehydrogenase subunit 2 [Steinernema glaseri]